MSGFFVANFALAEHTASVMVSPTMVKDISTNTYTFTVTNGSGDAIKKIVISIPSGFSGITETGTTCPINWYKLVTGTEIKCTDADGGNEIISGNNKSITFSAIAPNPDSDTSYPWTTVTTDTAGGTQSNTPTITVDVTPPTILSITTKDVNGDGKVETATILFSEPVDDSTFAAGNFTIGGVAGTSINTGATADDNTFNIVIADGIEGTEAKNVTYTQGTGADLVGNLLANVTTGTIIEVDGAAPIFISATAVSNTNINIGFSEPVSIVGTPVWGTAITATNLVATGGVISGPILTVTVNSLGNTAYTASDLAISAGIVKDAAHNQNAAISGKTITDGQTPFIASAKTKTITTIELTFSEPMSTVAGSDFAVVDNTISSITFTGGTTAILNLGTAIGTGAAPAVSTFATPTGTKDLANNIITGSLSVTPADGVSPTVAITSTATSPTKNSPIPMTATFSEAVSDFVIGDITVGNGTADNFAGSGAVYTFDITPTGQGAVTVDIAGGVAQDANSNVNTAATQFSIIFDSVAPDITSIVLADSALKVGETSLVTITFSEAVTGFDNTDITTIDNGTLTPVSSADGGITWTATFTPTNGITDDTNVITITKTGVADLAGNPGTGTTISINYVIDTVRPTVTAGLADISLIAGETTIVTFIFSEEPTGFDASDVTVYNGTIGAVSVTGNPLVFTATLTPMADIEDNTNILTVGTGWTDPAGNAPAGTTDSVNYTVETKKPSVVLASATADPTNGLIAVTAEFSETVTGFDGTDITVTNGAVESFVAVDSDSYTFNVNPTDGPKVAVTIEVSANKAVDAAGNGNTASNQLTYTSDTVAPTVTLTKDHADFTVRDADTVVVTATFNEAMTSSPTITITNVGITAVAMSGSGTTWTYSWNVPTGNDGAAVVTVAGTDLAGNAYVVVDNLTFTIDNIVPSALQTTAVTTPTNDSTPNVGITVETGASWVIKNGVADLTSGTGTGANQTVILSELTEGTYSSVQLIATDAAGNSTTVTLTTFTIDATPPSVAITSPLADSVTKGTTITLVSSASDLSGVTCQYKIDAGVLTPIDCSGGTISGLTDGRRVITLVATDSASNSASTQVSIVIDTNNTLTVASTGADFTTIQEAITKATANDTISVAAGIYNEDVTIGKNLKIVGTGNPTATSFTLSGNATLLAGSGGITAMTVTVNPGSKIQDGILLASNGGTVNVAAGSYTEGLTINESLTLQGAGSSLVTVTGNQTVTASSTLDGFTFSGTVTIDDSSAVVSGGTISNNIITGSGNGIRLGSGVGQGIDHITIRDNEITGNSGKGIAFYNAGDYAAQHISYITIDNNHITNNTDSGISTYGPGPNTITNNTVSGNTGNGISIKYDDGDIVTGNTVTGNAAMGINMHQVTNTIVENNTVSGQVSDGVVTNFWGGSITAGKGSAIYIHENSNGNTIRLNTLINNKIGVLINRESAVSNPANNSINNNTIAGNTVYGVLNALDSPASPADATRNWWGSANGPTHTSNPGGTGNAVSNNVNFRPWYRNPELTGLDTDAPTVTISTTASNPTNASSIPFSVTFGTGETVYDFTAADITVTNGTKGTLGGSGSTYTIDITPTANGAVTINIAVNVAWDVSGNYNTQSNTLSIVYDTVAPTATISGGPASLTNSNSVDITVGGTDVTYYKYKLDSGSYSAETSVATHITLSGLTDGEHTLSVIGRDAAGNWQSEISPTTHTWTVDTQAPTAAFATSTLPVNPTNQTSINITVAGTDVTYYKYKLDSGSYGSGTIVGTAISQSELAAGTHTISVIGRDAAENWQSESAATSYSWTIDTNAPIILSHTPDVNAVSIDPAANITITFNEAVVASIGNISFSPSFTQFTVSGSGTSIITISPTVPLTDNTVYTITVSGITDLAGNPISSYNWSFTTATNYQISLYSNVGGWNLISLPVVPVSTDISSVLGGATSSINAVWTYDPSNPNVDESGWLVYAPGDPADTNNLDVMTTGYGYWISVTANASLVGSGTLLKAGPTPPPSRELNSGWNLIGYYQIPGESTSTPVKAFSSLGGSYTGLWGFNNVSGNFKSVTGILPGDAFWISLSGSKIYTPSNL